LDLSPPLSEDGLHPVTLAIGDSAEIFNWAGVGEPAVSD
jgi:hypothetical protein